MLSSPYSFDKQIGQILIQKSLISEVMSSQNINQEAMYNNHHWDSYLKAKYSHQSMPSLMRVTNSHKYEWEAQGIRRLKQNMKRDYHEQFKTIYGQNSLRKKFLLSPLIMRGEKPIGQSQEFKLKSYLIKPLNDYENPPQEEQQDQQECKDQFERNSNHRFNTDNNTNINDSISQQLMNTTAPFSHLNSTFSKQFPSKQKLSYQDEVSQMLLTQSKFKYQPKNRLKIKKIVSKRSLNLSQADQLSCVGDGNGICSINNLPMELNKTKSQFSFRTLFTDKGSLSKGHSIEPLNVTRTKLLSKLNQLPKSNITKADLFPLQRLLQKRNRKVNFRNKWFNQNPTIQS